ncbi:hypothetical protein [Cellulomonas oligotrophica]|uniref:Uncharacterized protein n=1 Tax=Cellulomonas oligotrophica TaxID=931536 RepID=A0A7Y9FI81_9CELL|nr:hypothetical protein [Cellulomonas oligotrophica]NYD87673.1 hypothetical protein [Cellulomonas oligotrophica]GIG33122.1 hypothetical protein Col01nite_22810 [Cellulomonas oligotrophica]
MTTDAAPRTARRPAAAAARRAGAGALVLAALVVGHLVTDAVGVSSGVEAPFVRSGAVGERVTLRYAHVTAGEPDGSTVLDPQDGTLLSTPGVWLTVPLEVEVRGEPRSLGHAEVVGGDGRTYGTSVSGRSVFSTGTMQPGVPRWTTVRVELPVGAVPGARLRVALGSTDQRADDLAEIDLGLTAQDAQGWAADETPVVAGWYTDVPPEQQ